MDKLNDFMETSTIHGFYHIVATRKLLKLFWIIIVCTGFTGAAVMIHLSFKDWSESPIKTTIETKPLTDLTFPKISVCPPKGTFTNLNYDLVMTENVTLDNVTRKELIDYSIDVLNEYHFQDLKKNLSMFLEDNRFFNWYHGHTLITLPYFFTGTALQIVEEGHLKLKLETSATSGSVSTQYFGNEFDVENVTGNIAFIVTLYVPKNEDFPFEYAEKMSLYCEIEKESIEHISNGYDNFKLSGKETINIPQHERYSIQNYTPALNSRNKFCARKCDNSDSYYKFTMERIITMEEITEKNLNRMPGFKMKWHYEMFQKIDSLGLLVREPRKTQAKYYSHPRTIEFKRYNIELN